MGVVDFVKTITLFLLFTPVNNARGVVEKIKNDKAAVWHEKAAYYR